MIFLILYFTNMFLALIVAIAFGPKRNIGDNWSFFFGATLSVFLQILMTVTSHLKKDKITRTSNPGGWILCFIGIPGLLVFLYKFFNGNVNYVILDLSAGLTGWGLYLLRPSFLKSVND